MDAAAEQLPLREPKLFPARCSLDDFRALELRHRPKDNKRKFVLRIFHLVLAIDHQLLAVLQYLFDDDRLDRYLTRNPIGIKKIDRVE